MTSRAIAIIDQTNAIPAAELARGAAAVQKQVTNDFGPIWNRTATVDVFPTLADKPLDSWPVVIRKKLGVDGAGVHVSRDGNKAFALVRATPGSRDWMVTLSHEILEMLADPFGTDSVSGPSPLNDGRTVHYLQEVCDPCQGPERDLDPDFTFQYMVNGVFLSDFVLPAYYKAFGPGRYSFTGRVTQPRELLLGGYFTWQDPFSEEWSANYFDGNTTTTFPLGKDLSQPDVHLRGFIDRKVTAALQQARKGRKRQKPAGVLPARAAYYEAATAAQAVWWQSEIDRAIAKPAASSEVLTSPNGRGS